MRILCYLWAMPVTLIGLLLAVLAALSGGNLQLRSGIIEAWGGIVGWWLKGGRFHRGGAAVALGHVILARDALCLEQSRSHERAHIRQYERFGPLLLPMYWLVGAWLWFRGYDAYLDHPLEPPPE